jgi:hypothetical protein
MMQRIIFSIACLASLTAAQTDVRGIFIFTNDVSRITNATAAELTQSFSIPGVDGVAIVIGWDAIEPTRGQFQWTLLDQWVTQAVALGKKIDLVIPSGSATPSWLFDPPPSGAGVAELKFTISPHKWPNQRLRYRQHSRSVGRHLSCGVGFYASGRLGSPQIDRHV